MTRLEKTLSIGGPAELDVLGKLLDAPRRFYGQDHIEADETYRKRLGSLPIVQLLTYWQEPGGV